MGHDLDQLAALIRKKNEVDKAVSDLIGRLATPGNIGEFVAARIFGIRLEDNGAHPGYDGRFEAGPLTGKTVNIKAYSRHESILDISSHPCDYYLVLTGPPGSSRVTTWCVESVFLLEAQSLLEKLTERGVRIGVATGVLKAHWEAARVYPPQPESPLKLASHQLELLSLFSRSAVT